MLRRDQSIYFLIWLRSWGSVRVVGCHHLNFGGLLFLRKPQSSIQNYLGLVLLGIGVCGQCLVMNLMSELKSRELKVVLVTSILWNFCRAQQWLFKSNSKVAPISQANFCGRLRIHFPNHASYGLFNFWTNRSLLRLVFIIVFHENVLVLRFVVVDVAPWVLFDFLFWSALQIEWAIEPSSSLTRARR